MQTIPLLITAAVLLALAGRNAEAHEGMGGQAIGIIPESLIGEMIGGEILLALEGNSGKDSGPDGYKGVSCHADGSGCFFANDQNGCVTRADLTGAGDHTLLADSHDGLEFSNTKGAAHWTVPDGQLLCDRDPDRGAPCLSGDVLFVADSDNFRILAIETSTTGTGNAVEVAVLKKGKDKEYLNKPQRLMISPHHPQTLWCSTYRGIYKIKLDGEPRDREAELLPATKTKNGKRTLKGLCADKKYIYYVGQRTLGRYDPETGEAWMGLVKEGSRHDHPRLMDCEWHKKKNALVFLARTGDLLTLKDKVKGYRSTNLLELRDDIGDRKSVV